MNAFSLGLAASSSTASAGGTVQFTVILRYAAGPSPEFTFDNDPCDVPFEVLASDSSGKAVPGFAPQTSPCSFHSGPNTLQLVKHPGHASYLAAGEKIVEVAPLSRFYPGGLPHGKITLIADRIITTPTSAFDVVSGPVTLAIGP